MIRQIALVSLLASLMLPHPCAAVSDGDRQSSAITINKLREEISGHQEKIEQAGKEEHSLLDELAALDSQLGALKAKIEVLQTRLREQEQIIAVKEQALAAIVQKNEALRQHLIKRLQSFYVLGRTGTLNVIFSSATLPDLLLVNDSFHSLVSYDQKLFVEYRKSVADIDRAKRAHELEKAVQEHFLEDAAREKSALKQVAEEKNAVLKQIRLEKGLYEQALKEMKKAENDLLGVLAKSNQTPQQKAIGFAANKRKLPPPAHGKVTRRFQASNTSGEDDPFANGITIKTPEHAEIFAVYGGVVIFSGYMSGYGKMIIVEHDQDYFSVTARVDDPLVQEGDLVQQGQTIGFTGEADTPFGEGLYFEIRHGAQPENPLDWLQPGALPTR